MAECRILIQKNLVSGYFVVSMRPERLHIMKIKSLPAEERPMEKGLYQGMNSLSNAELLALVINSGTKEKSAILLAQQVISQAGDIQHLGDITPQELMGIPGIGPGKAARISAALELGKRMASRSPSAPVCVDNPDDIAALFMEEMRGLKQENFRILLLSVKGSILSAETISRGDLSSTPVHPREVFRPAVKKSAAAIILIHNHPSGDPTPSRQDIEITKQIGKASEILNIPLVDHIIIGDNKYTSLKEAGYL